MKVSLDGGQTYVESAESVRVIYDLEHVPGEDGEGELHVNLTHEGIIKDVWVSRDESLDHNLATSSQTVDDIVEEMIDDEAEMFGYQPGTKSHVLNNLHCALQEAQNGLNIKDALDAVGWTFEDAFAAIEEVRDKKE